MAVAINAVPVLAGKPQPPTSEWREDRDRFPHGVASGDPDDHSVILWTRVAPDPSGKQVMVELELAEGADFQSVLVRRHILLSSDTDWTCRVLAGGLAPRRIYWYRFTDANGRGSRIGRTMTAPGANDHVPATFAFVSCQNVNLGPLTAWRRMIHDDQDPARNDHLDFVLHLGDFVYETVWYPQDRSQGYFDRTVRDVVDYPTGEKHDDYHVPTSLADYRTLYRAYLEDPDLQDARARWPFVAIWDNGEYSDKGWQGLQRFGNEIIAAQTRKVAANQAWFEYIPARVKTLDGSLDRFTDPGVHDAPITTFDSDGLGREPNNIAAIRSLSAYRTLRWGRHVELILTDQRSYRSEDFTAVPEAKAIASTRFPQMVPFETLQAIDAGRESQNGTPPDTLVFGDRTVLNFRSASPPPTLLGRTQKAWFLDRLSRSTATWKIWGDTVATLDMRADPQNLPPGLTVPWPGQGYAGYARADHSTTYAERGSIYDFIADRGITGFVTVSGDRHSFWAGYASKNLPPETFEPIGLSFVAGSISSPGMVEAFEHVFPARHPLRPLYLIDRVSRSHPEASVNLLLKHGVRTCLDYAEHADLERAKALSNPNNAPHVEFVDMGGHGYGIVRATAKRIEVEFVCVPRPVADPGAPDGGPLRYRITHAADLWAPRSAPRLDRVDLDGDAELST